MDFQAFQIFSNVIDCEFLQSHRNFVYTIMENVINAIFARVRPLLMEITWVSAAVFTWIFTKIHRNFQKRWFVLYGFGVENLIVKK